ncbi:MAG: hypothetical protein ABH827_00210 [bacterium]
MKGFHVSRLEMLMEQTDYLLHAQHKAKDETQAIFSELLLFLNSTIKQTQSADAKELLEEIHEMLTSHAQQFTEEVESDIEFLDDQVKALAEIKQVKDAKKAKELLAAIIDDEEELPETKEFKTRINQDYDASKKALIEMVSDIKASINEGDTKQVKLFLEALLSEHEDEDISDEDLANFQNMLCDDEKCDGCDGCEGCEDEEDDDEDEDKIPATKGNKNIFTPASSKKPADKPKPKK